MKKQIFVLASFAPAELSGFTGWSLRSEVIKGSAESGHILDTFDWLLWQADCVLFSSPSLLRLYRGGKTVSTEISLPPETYEDIPEGKLRDIVRISTSPRVLEAKAECALKTGYFSIINEDGKTVCRLGLTEISTDGFSCYFAELMPMKGYEKEAALVQAALEDQGGKETRKSPPVYALRKSGLKPGAYKTSAEADNIPDARTGDVLRDILLQLLNIMEQNEEGVTRGRDPEFLHDYRVALRRSRSAFSMFRGVFPPEEHSHFRERLSGLFALTSLSRDLDVYIKKIREYREILPEDMRDELLPVEKYLINSKKKEQGKLIALFGSEEYRSLKSDWRDFLTREIHTEQGERCVRDSAAEVIKNAYGKILKSGRRLHAGSPAGEIHRVRIGCKKLRYALEFFRPLFPEKAADTVTKKLKNLQDALGAHQDYEVQREKLLYYTEEAAKKLKNPLNLSVASGYLARYLDELQSAERDKCLELIEDFVSVKTRGLIREMLK
ncbi:CHAD domain-containing protein [Geovibrio thiophilus]|uniref:CHAD domain-containing protein n=1 Tax=Geovibrio thiophilus TaxID=139438 RepID=A0A410K0F3_9BACT|nr:CHAD domain-containing protein [Geovibrio thiophilus]QAR33884.1 CHAD domain-containing protein [Geovibrio thiophilus]